MAFLAIIVVLALLALVYEKRQNGVREKEWALERAALLQRIQAPEVAVYQAAKRERRRKRIPEVPYGDDEAYYKAKEALNGDGD